MPSRTNIRTRAEEQQATVPGAKKGAVQAEKQLAVMLAATWIDDSMGAIYQVCESLKRH